MMPQGFYENISKIHKDDLEPLNEKVLGPISRFTNETTKYPFVFLLGNHSSGKSTFINYVLGRDIQHCGVAPTDDSFTLIAPGDDDLDQDGASLVGSEELGFKGLRQFGGDFLTHLQFKVRRDLALKDIIMVDSPGMIDSPRSSMQSFEEDGYVDDRGYDFRGVTRWLAQRADVILLFFDPEKPGTTGETLDILTNSLEGTEHKLLLILNKADQFSRMNDFARAYGALCWNLSKVIARKDLPQIHTMCVPVSDTVASASAPGLREGRGGGLQNEDMFDDLRAAREEVIDHVVRAPERRIDNLVTSLYNSAMMLNMHARVGGAVRRAYTMVGFKQWAATVGLFSVGQGIAAAGLYSFELVEFGVAMSSVAFAVAGMHHYFSRKHVERDRSDLLSDEGLSRIFEKEYFKEIASGDYFVQTMWERGVRSQLQVALQTTGVKGMHIASSSELKRLNDIMETEVPRLRAAAAPSVTQSPSSGVLRNENSVVAESGLTH